MPLWCGLISCVFKFGGVFVLPQRSTSHSHCDLRIEEELTVVCFMLPMLLGAMPDKCAPNIVIIVIYNSGFK